ncbi:MAG: hypothetical protein UR56_C0008G0006 [Candidatus Roizmanbacteria bacterium GW2011_GWC2_34_23]|uniref:Uncharacterized protein n=1 Tax=Candidatus Roizmanbacteria bacterium GW2011_GWC2_34_23 TaxID=1618484 RepID=A0A0G0E2W8_9BACT|nr:MAG: hypothetical protein UR56_C0008G0006 [Candidatus Roizmanbacteria bacterium GW2011_GWC2_34_23]
MQEATAQLPVAKATLQKGGEGKIGVGTLNVSTEKKAPAPTTPEASAAQKADLEMKKAAEALTIQLVADAKAALVENGREALKSLKLVSGNEAIVYILEGQRDAEYAGAGMIKDPKEQQQKYTEIKKRYEKLMQYSENRQNETRLNISRLKKSEDPKDKALAIDLENTNAERDIQSYNMTIGRIRQILETGINPRTGQQLEKQERTRYSSELANITSKKIILEEDTKKSKDARDNMRDIDGKPIKNVIKDMATALSGKEQENPIEFLEQRITKALTSEASMNQLAEELVEIKVLKEGDKKKFLEDMTLGLSWSDHVAISKKVGGNIFMMMMSLSGLLAYVAAQKLREGGGMQG